MIRTGAKEQKLRGQLGHHQKLVHHLEVAHPQELIDFQGVADSQELVLQPRQPDDHNCFWRCGFCPREEDTIDALSGHIESVHQNNLFKLDCKLCSFEAEGPSLLRQHTAESHGSGDGPGSTTTKQNTRPTVFNPHVETTRKPKTAFTAR